MMTKKEIRLRSLLESGTTEDLSIWLKAEQIRSINTRKHPVDTKNKPNYGTTHTEK